MSKKNLKNDSPFGALKSESARQRWELFHRAIAYAKDSNNASHAEGDNHSVNPETAGPLLSIVR